MYIYTHIESFEKQLAITSIYIVANFLLLFVHFTRFQKVEIFFGRIKRRINRRTG